MNKEIYYVSFSGNHVLSEIVPRPNSVYFIESSGSSKLDARVACSIESAAKHHPNNTIVSKETNYFLLNSYFVKNLSLK